MDLEFEVGAEIELQEDEAVEEAPLILENKQDLPSWETLHNSDDSSGDEGLDPQAVLSHLPSEVEIQNMLNSFPKNKSQIITKQEVNQRIASFSISKGLCDRLNMYGVDLGEEPERWNTTYKHWILEQPSGVEGISAIDKTKIVRNTEQSRSPSWYQAPFSLQEACSVTSLSQDKKRIGSGNYHNNNVITHLSSYVKPLIKIYQCTQCGCQFQSLGNLKGHLCLKRAVGFTQGSGESSSEINLSATIRKEAKGQEKVSESNQESVELLEQMCVQAQKELRIFKKKYGKGGPLQKKEIKLLPKPIKNDDPADALMVNKVGSPTADKIVASRRFFIRPYVCDKCQRPFRRKCNLDRHICSKKSKLQRMQGAPRPNAATAMPKLVRGIPSSNGRTEQSPFTAPGKPTSQLMSRAAGMPRLKMKGEPVFCSNSTGRVHKSYSCQQCGGMFVERCAYATHIRWHMKKAEGLQMNAVNQTVKKVILEDERLGHDVSAQKEEVQSLPRGGEDGTSLLYSCYECGSCFRLKCNLVRHLNWHMRQNIFVGGEEKKYYGDDIIYTEVETYQQVPSEVPESSFELVVGTEDEDEQGSCTLASEDEIVQSFIGTEFIEEVGASAKTVSQEEQLDRYEMGIEWDFQTPEERSKRQNPCPVHLPRDLLAQIASRPQLPYRCRDCGARFHQAWQLKRHRHRGEVRKVTTRRKHRCDCGRAPVGSLHFLRHQLQHLIDTVFICAECGKSLRGYRKLRTHSLLHPLVSRFQCTCGVLFSQLPRYLWHSLLNRSFRRVRGGKVGIHGKKY
ncbi:hypothetical protein FKM82_013015 [Ascaphus truei]